MTTYYTLAVRDDGVWAPQFGDYDRDTVVDEKLDYLDHGYSVRDLKIIRTCDTLAAVNDKIALLNHTIETSCPHRGRIEDGRNVGRSCYVSRRFPLSVVKSD